MLDISSSSRVLGDFNQKGLIYICAEFISLDHCQLRHVTVFDAFLYCQNGAEPFY